MTYDEHIKDVKIANSSSQQVASVLAGQCLGKRSTSRSERAEHCIDTPGEVREYLLQRLEGLIETYKMLPIVKLAQDLNEDQEFNSYIFYSD